MIERKWLILFGLATVFLENKACECGFEINRTLLVGQKHIPGKVYGAWKVMSIKQQGVIWERVSLVVIAPTGIKCPWMWGWMEEDRRGQWPSHPVGVELKLILWFIRTHGGILNRREALLDFIFGKHDEIYH